ncbi:MAG: T9SS sorting signal type C domain-containing protein, partial [Bacteroidia bacterium]|nr:T9SS sorting signal type C domain-containing protein [Bacteroidia bacterium]
QNDVFHIYSRGFEMKEVTVYDVLGRVVYSDASEGNSHILPYLGANQVLVVQVITANEEVLSKKVGN